MSASIRLAAAADLDAINAIYNHYVAVSTTTYDDEPMTAEERRQWFAGRQPIHPITVAVLDDANPSAPTDSSLQPPASSPIVGYGSLHAFRGKRGYRFVVENSVYVTPDLHRQGIGSIILADQIERARTLGLHAIVAGIDSEQTASIALHAKHGFQEVARFPQIGYKFNRRLDVVFMERLLD